MSGGEGAERMRTVIAIALGDSRATAEGVLRERFPNAAVDWLDRDALRRRPLAQVAWLATRVYGDAALVAADLAAPRVRLTSLLLVLPNARRRWRFDAQGRAEPFSVVGHLRRNALSAIRHVLACGLASTFGYPLLRLTEIVLGSPSHSVPSDRPRRLLYLRSQFWIGLRGGGSVAHAAGVIAGLQQAGVAVHVVASDRLHGVSAPTTVLRPECWFDGGVRDIEELAYNVPFAMAAIRAAHRWQPDAIYQRYAAFNCTGAVLARLLRVPLVLEFNSSEVWKGRHWGGTGHLRLAGAAERLNLRAADRVVVVSRVLRDDLVESGVAPQKILVNPNGVDPIRFHPDVPSTAVRAEHDLPASCTVVGFAGTFGVWHGIPTLAAVLPLVAQARPNVRFLMIGDGPLRSLVDEAVERYGLAGRVASAGLVPHETMPAYLAACDVLVSPHGRQLDGGEFFGSPTKLYEYMAAGRAIVASDVGQIGDVLEDETSALLVPPEDVEALASAILRLVDDPALRARLGAAARGRAARDHTWRQNAERVLVSLALTPPPLSQMQRGPAARLVDRARDVVDRLRRTPARRLPGKLYRLASRSVASSRARRRLLRRGEISDRTFLQSLGGRFDSTAEAVAYFQGRSGPRFFIGDADEAGARARALASAYPALAERTRCAAERALRHQVDLLGSGLVDLGATIDWHSDFKVGYAWPRGAFPEEIDHLALHAPCDVKVPWELSRGYHWVALGRAYALDRDARYAHEFVSQLHAWLDANPWPCGVNWARAMEVAVRAVNWLWAAALFDDAGELDERTRLRLLKALLQHGRYIFGHLEYSDNNGNHYLSNGVGLLLLGIMFPEFRDAELWRRKGSEIVWGEIERQVRPDGVDFEQGIGYHGLVLEFWYTCAILCDLNGIPVPPLARERLANMFEFVLAYTRPDGTFPQVGDNDDGRLAGLDDEPVGSHRRHLAVGGALLERGDMLAVAGDAVETAVWLLGPAVLSAPRAPSATPSRAFPDGGFYVMRAGDDPLATGGPAVMLIDAGEAGMNGIGGHGHNDVLSFDLWAAGAPLLSDSGTYTYTADPALRQQLRATAAHNTVRVDGLEVARLGQGSWLWRIENDALPTVHRWDATPKRDVLDAEHAGYARIGVTHRRTICFDKRRRLWLIRDALEGHGERAVELFFHPACPIAEQAGLAVRLRAPQADCWIAPLDPPTGLVLQQESGWLSRGYGHREPAIVLVYRARLHLPVVITTAIALVPPGGPYVRR